MESIDNLVELVNNWNKKIWEYPATSEEIFWTVFGYIYYEKTRKDNFGIK